MRDVVPLLLVAFVAYGKAHVALTFPEARYPALDFLDTSRTMGPCGVPKQRKAHYTNLLVGKDYNITWRMQYPHQGGYRIVLVDDEDNTIEQLAPSNGLEFMGVDNQTVQSQLVRISQPCPKCTIILERQALEWGKSYRFRSCGDVNVLQTISEEDECTGHGTLVNGGCECKKGYKGDLCQYMTNCNNDSECLNDGKCLSEPHSIAVASCYCAYGFYGNNCELALKRENDRCFAYSMLDEEHYDMYGMFNSSCYNRDKLSNSDYVYYRKVEGDVEIILDYMSTSWVSIGWRPEGLDRSCRLFPDLEGARSEGFVSAGVQSPTQQTSSQRVRREQTQIPKQLNNDGFVFDRDHPPARIAQEGPRPVMPRDNGILESALHAPLHAMDCIDILIGAVRDGRSRVQDSYSRDRSTPLEDFWYEGEMSLVAAYGRELDGRTIIMFRRPMQEIEPTDHPLGPGQMFAVWAKGQQQGAYAHGAPSALDVVHSNETFYQDDILKYHGSKNRGVLSINFTKPVKPSHHNDVSTDIKIVTKNIAQLPAHNVTKQVTSTTPTTKSTRTYYRTYEGTDGSTIHRCTALLVIVTVFIQMY